METFFLCFLTVVITNEVFGVSEFCFGCKDTTDAKGKDNCQEQNLQSMNDLHAKYIYQYKRNSTNFLQHYQHSNLIQDCRDYHQFGIDKCCIEMLEQFGKVRSYIRACCDGIHFSLNTTNIPRLQPLTTNNQSLCGYDDSLGYRVCVSMCDGDFCNGPSLAASVPVSSALLTLCFVVTILWKVSY